MQPSRDSFPVVGIGASAGGVEALSRLFQQLGTELHAAFVVVTHLARHRESLLPEILARYTRMPVVAAIDGQPIEPGRLYLNSPDTILTVMNSRFVVTERTEERNPIDILLASVAVSAGHRAIAVILSGTGTDGAIGVKAVREAGGLTLAQRFDGDPNAHHGMPDAAVATGFVDDVLPIEALAARLTDYIASFATTGLNVEQPDEEARNRLDAAKAEICAILHARVGHDFSGYKTSTFLRRLARRMQVRRILDLPGYTAFIRANAEEADLLFRELLIGVSSFFRDPSAYDVLNTLVIPNLFSGRDAGDSIRVWVPACSTGEEAYTIAILLREHAGTSQVRLQIFATDVDESALAVARQGRYPAKLLESQPPDRLARFFVREGSSLAVAKEIRDICMFSCHNLIRDPPFSRVDLISCRNLLIYFGAALQNQVMPLFHYALRPSGFLFLGSSEHASRHATLFEAIDGKHRVFRRRNLPGRPTIFPSVLQSVGQHALRAVPTSPTAAKPDIVARGQALVLDRYAPAHVIVNRQWGVLHFSVRTGKYIEAPSGSPSRDLLAMVRKGLAPSLRSALNEAAETGHATRRDNVGMQTEAGTQSVSIVVEPIQDRGVEAVWLVIFTDTVPPDGEAERATPATPTDRDEALRQLEGELAETRQQLTTAIEEHLISDEELKSINEEMLSMNEELQSANEELETSKEELQSVNEELHSVNAELSDKVDELDRSNNDVRNLLDSTQIATLFLDESLNIRTFTPAVSEVFRLLPGDRGRSILDFGNALDYGELAGDANATLASGAALERKLVTRDGMTHFLVRLLPYRKADDVIDGVILTFVNVTSLVELGHQQALVSELNHRVKNVLAVVSSLAHQLARRCTTLQEFDAGFADRMAGLASTHSILARNSWVTAPLSGLIIGELRAFVADAGRVTVSGPEVQLNPHAATTLGIAIHELATNAVKYGALAAERGRLVVTWAFEMRDEAEWLVLEWRENGGPPIVEPQRKGFGTELIERSLAYEFDGSARIEFLPDGVVVTLALPGEHVTHDAGPS